MNNTTKKYFIDKKITEQLMELIDSGELPWQKPWNILCHKNLMANRFYRGLNPLILSMFNERNDFNSTLWVTLKVAKKFDNCIKADQFKNPAYVYLFKFEEKEDDNGDKYTQPIFRYYRVWNIDQCKINEDMQKLIDKRTPEKLEFNPIEKAEEFIKGYQDKPEVKHGGNRAFYMPTLDYVQLPPKKQFKSSEEYYSTKFHEFAHSTGHKNRLNRFNNEDKSIFKSESYSFEELIAEFTNAFCCSATGITNIIKNSAAYIQSWKKALNDNPDWLRKAASKAHQAFDYMQGIRY